MIDTPTFLDALVVGGGPAGALTALRLARLGWSVALVERGPRHREKTCGHCLNARGAALLERAGVLAEVRRIACGRTDRARVHHERRRRVVCSSVDPDAGRGGMLVRRAEFDQVLLDAAARAGARILQPASATVVATDGAAATVSVRHGGVTGTVACRLLVGADGLGSAVGRAIGLDAAAPGRKYGFSFEIEGRDLAAGSIELFVVDGGYVGAVRQHDDRVHVAGLVGAPGAGDGARREPFAFVRSIARRFESLRALGLDRVERGGVTRFTAAGPMPWRPRRVATARGALVGDAAGYVEPFTGEGMTWALHGATLLADVVSAAAPGAWTVRHAERYHAAHASAVRRRQRTCGWLAACLERPMLREALFAVAGRHRPITEAIGRRVGRA